MAKARAFAKEARPHIRRIRPNSAEAAKTAAAATTIDGPAGVSCHSESRSPASAETAPTATASPLGNFRARHRRGDRAGVDRDGFAR